MECDWAGQGILGKMPQAQSLGEKRHFEERSLRAYCLLSHSLAMIGSPVADVSS
jgi:hypothetical protein